MQEHGLVEHAAGAEGGRQVSGRGRGCDPLLRPVGCAHAHEPQQCASGGQAVSWVRPAARGQEQLGAWLAPSVG